MNKEYAGLGGFVWWVGVVEDRNDPLKLGRCRVRIFGWHSESIVDCPTKSLPWAQAMMPLNNANTYTPKESDMVVGFFTDGENAQQPVMMGILPGIPLATPNPQQGFNDTRDGKQLFVSPVKPEDDKTNYPRKLDEPTTSQLARYDSEPYQISNLKANLEKLERQPSYNAKYPYNNAMESESGHAIEIDDTPKYERIHIYHRMGSNQEYRPDGSVQQKIVADSTRNIGGDDLNYIKGNSLFVIDGDLTYVVKGKITFVSEKDIIGAAEGSVSFSAKDSFSASADISASVSGKLSSSLGGASLLTSVSGGKTSVSGVGSVSASSLGYAEFGASGATTINGSTINFLSASATVPSSKDSSQNFGTDVNKYDKFDISTKPDLVDKLGNVIDAGGTKIVQTSTQSIAGSQSVFNAANYSKEYWTSTVDISRIANSTDFSRFTTEITNSIQKNITSLAGKITDKITSLPTDVSNSIGIPQWQKSYDAFKRASSVASSFQSIETAKSLASATTDFLGATAQVATNINNANIAGIGFEEYLRDICALKSAENVGRIYYNKAKEKVDEILEPLQKLRDEKIEAIKNSTREYKDNLKQLERKSLREWADSHAYDTSCATCANEVTTNLNNNMPEDKAKEVLLQCLYREADAFINKNKSTLPITGSKIIEQEKDICGTTEIKVNI